MNKRDSNFELLRIIAIIMVIAIHTVSQMIIIAFPEKLTWKFCAAIFSLTHTAVPVFILLTGYFSYKSHSPIKSRVKKLVYPFLTYFIVFFIFALFYRPGDMPLKTIVFTQLFSITSNSLSFYFGQMYYLYTLLFVVILSPFINKLIENLEQKAHKNLIIVLVVFLFGIPTINTLFDYNIVYPFVSSNIKLMLPSFISYYVIGAYFAKYDIKVSKVVSLSTFILSTVLIYVLTYFWSVYHPLANVLQRLGIILPSTVAKLHESNGFTKNFMNYDSLLILISACGLFLFFKELKIKHSKIINYIASLTFGVYINHLFVRNIITENFIKIDGVYGMQYIYSALIIMLLTVVFSIIIEVLRNSIVKIIYNKLSKSKN